MSSRSLTRIDAALLALASPQILLAATAVLVAILYGRWLARSLWVDETMTYWFAHEGPLVALQKTWHTAGQSVLFSVVSSLFCFDGNPYRDQILRIPSLLGIAATCYILYRFAEDVIGRGAGWIAATLFVFSPMALQLGPQARPYALAMAAAAASCWTLVRWTATHERRWLGWYVVSSALVLYLHYLFALLFLAHAVFLLSEVRGGLRSALWRELVLAYAAIGILVAPIVPHFMFLVRESHRITQLMQRTDFKSIARKPAMLDLPDFLLPSTVGLGLLLAGLLVHSLFRARPPVAVRLPSSCLAMLATLWVAGPLIAFVASFMTPTRMFVERYISYSGLGLVMLLAYAGYSMFGSQGGRVWALLGMAAIVASPLRVAFGAGSEEPKPFLDIIRHESTRARSLPPVLFRSEMPDSDFYNWRAANTNDSLLYTSFVAYPIPNPLLPLPSQLTPEVKDYVSGLLESGLKDLPEVLLVTHDASSIPWFTDRFGAAGFGARVVRPNGFNVVVFERSGVGRMD